MTLWIVGYLAASVLIFLVASHPFLAEMRNSRSLYDNMKKILQEKKPGAKFMLFSFINLLAMLIVLALFFP